MEAILKRQMLLSRLFLWEISDRGETILRLPDSNLRTRASISLYNWAYIELALEKSAWNLTVLTFSINLSPLLHGPSINHSLKLQKCVVSAFYSILTFLCVENRSAQAEELEVLKSIYGEENCRISSTNQFCEVMHCEPRVSRPPPPVTFLFYLKNAIYEQSNWILHTISCLSYSISMLIALAYSCMCNAPVIWAIEFISLNPIPFVSKG